MDVPNEEFELLKLKIEQLKEAEKVKVKKKTTTKKKRLNLEFQRPVVKTRKI